MKDNGVRKSCCCFMGFNVPDYISIRTSNLLISMRTQQIKRPNHMLTHKRPVCVLNSKATSVICCIVCAMGDLHHES